MITLHHIPTLAEAIAAQRPGLHESYWWVTGWNFNRPHIARVGIGAHIHEGSYVWVEMGDNCPQFGYKAANLAGISFTFYGPIELPQELQ